jgi:hypothetical protein
MASRRTRRRVTGAAPHVDRATFAPDDYGGWRRNDDGTITLLYVQ